MTRRMLAAAMFILAGTLSGAQATGSISGTVKDDTGAVLPGVTVSATGLDQKAYTSVTDAEGRYAMSGIPPGTYVVVAQLAGFAPTRRTTQVRLGSAAATDLTLNGGGLPVLLEPRYHVAVDEVRAGTINHVTSLTKAVARFWIAPADRSPDQDLGNWAVNPALLKLRGRTPLTIYMRCSACGVNLSSAPLTYDSSTKRSAQANFEFTPDRRLAEPDGTARLEFTVLRAGALLDKVVATLMVDAGDRLGADIGGPDATTPGTLGGPSSEAPGARSERPRVQSNDLPIDADAAPVLETDPRLLADFTLEFRADAGRPGAAILEIHAESDRARTIAAASKVFDQQWKTFRAPVDRARIDSYAGVVYVALKDLILARPDASTVLSTVAPGLPPWSRSVADHMSNEDYDKAVKALAISSTLYNEIFNRDQDLSRAMEAIESARVPADSPIRIAIVTDGLLCPWALLRRPGDTDVKHFWGFKYELAVIPMSVQGKIAPPSPIVGGKVPLAYVAVPDAPTRASIGGMAAEEYRSLQSQKAVALDSFRSRTTFLDGVKAQHASMRFIYAFIHGSDGTTSTRDPNDPTTATTARTTAGPRVMFKLSDATEVVTPFALSGVKSALGIGYGPLFDAHPIVILNACEGGSAGSSNSSNLGAADGFPYTFLDLGASGIVAADAPVWALFAVRFGHTLVADVLKGTDLPRAVRNARLAELDRDHNPLGLLYAYFGPMNVRIH